MLNTEIEAETKSSIAPEIPDSAWKRLEITYDPIRPSLVKSAEAAHAAGFLEEKPDLSKIYELRFLTTVLTQKKLPEILK